MRPVAFAGAVLATLWFGGSAASAATYGLAIGVDDYGDEDLRGAVADAEGIAAGLEAAGAARVDLLINGEAGRQAVEGSWAELLSEARYGDTIVVSFAGKGGRGEGGPHYLLGGGDPLSRKMVLDWARAAEEKGVNLLFVGDASFTGGLERAYPQDLVRLRQVKQGEAPEDGAGSRPENGFSKATFADGAPTDKAVPELTIGEASRGGLSWAFAQALGGAAEEDFDGLLSDRELGVYLPLAVGVLTEGQQQVQVVPRRSSSLTFFPVGPGAGDKAPQTGPLRIAVDGEAAVVGAFPNVEIVDDLADATLIWSVADQTVTHRIGGVVASGVNANQLGDVLAKWSALDWVTGLAARSPVSTELVSGPDRLTQGARAQIEILPGRYPMLTIFDLGPKGEVSLIAPADPNEAAKPANRRHIHQMFQVGEGPDGALHRVVIFSEEPLTRLHQAIEDMAGQTSAEGLRQALIEALPPDAKVQAGILPIYTGPKPAAEAD